MVLSSVGITLMRKLTVGICTFTGTADTSWGAWQGDSEASLWGSWWWDMEASSWGARRWDMEASSWGVRRLDMEASSWLWDTEASWLDSETRRHRRGGLVSATEVNSPHNQSTQPSLVRTTSLFDHESDVLSTEMPIMSSFCSDEISL